MIDRIGLRDESLKARIAAIEESTGRIALINATPVPVRLNGGVQIGIWLSQQKGESETRVLERNSLAAVEALEALVASS